MNDKALDTQNNSNSANLLNICSEIALADGTARAVQIMGLCRSLSPAVYRSMNDSELRGEMTACELMFGGLSEEMICYMLKFAIEDFARRKSADRSTVMSINYICEYHDDAEHYIKRGYKTEKEWLAELMERAFADMGIE
jgi:hypothetical protein